MGRTPLLLLILCAVIHFTGILALHQDECHLKWNGVYHVSGSVNPLRFNKTWMDSLGRCVASSQNNQNYIFRFDLSGGACYRCVAIFDVHSNILQYKQSGCIKQYNASDDVETSCRRSLRGDTPMKMLFRIDAKPEKCPFAAPFNFTYATYDGSCVSRNSSVTACSAFELFRFQYQACPELSNSETHVDELECIAHWNSFGVEFFAVRITNSSVTGPNTYRCLIHQKTLVGGRMGISADSSCSELMDIAHAGITLDYTQGLAVKPQCHFPSFLRHAYHSVERQRWISVATNSTHEFREEEWVETLNGTNHSVSLCLHTEDLGNFHSILVYTARHCTSGYQCIKIKRKHRNIVEVSHGELLDRDPPACKVSPESTYDTLVREDAQVVRCPHSRRLSTSTCSLPVVHFGCTYAHEMEIHQNCGRTSPEKFSCLGHWTEDEVQYTVSRDLTTSALICYSYSTYPEDAIRIRSYRHIACHPGSLGHFQPLLDLHITNYEECSPLNGVSRSAGICLFSAMFILIRVH